MRAYLSYTIQSIDHSLVSRLSKTLRDRGVSISSGRQSSLPQHLALSESEIKKAELFIGITSSRDMRTGTTTKVLAEYKIAKKFRKPTFLLIDVSTPISYSVDRIEQTKLTQINSKDIIYFNRFDPDEAINQIEKRIESKKVDQNSNTAAWILGGIALIALIGAFSNKK